MGKFIDVDVEINGDNVDVTCRKTGSKWTYQNGKLHNLVGPAYEPGPKCTDAPEYFLEGEQLSAAEWYRRTQPKL